MHRIAGQVGGVEKMIADDRYCIDILTQISAVGTALEAVAFTILDDHVNHCVAHALASGDKAGGGRKEPGAARSRPPLRPDPLGRALTAGRPPARRPRPGYRLWPVVCGDQGARVVRLARTGLAVHDLDQDTAEHARVVEEGVLHLAGQGQPIDDASGRGVLSSMLEGRQQPDRERGVDLARLQLQRQRGRARTPGPGL